MGFTTTFIERRHQMAHFHHGYFEPTIEPSVLKAQSPPAAPLNPSIKQVFKLSLSLVGPIPPSMGPSHLTASLEVRAEQQRVPSRGVRRALLEQLEVDLILLVPEARELGVVLADHLAHRIDRALHEAVDLLVAQLHDVALEQRLRALLPDLFALLAFLVQAEAEHQLVDCDRYELSLVLRVHHVTVLQQHFVQF